MSAPVSVKDRELARQRQIVAEIRAEREKKTYACARSREWSLMQIELKMALLMLAGIDGDLGALAKKVWQEYSPDERRCLQVTARSVFAGLGDCIALRVRAG